MQDDQHTSGNAPCILLNGGCACNIVVIDHSYIQQWILKLRSHNASYCLTKVVTKTDLIVLEFSYILVK
jgi:hypothetical protein